MNRVERIRDLLTRAFEPLELSVIDDSHLHAGHAGARGGAGHYRVEIVSAAFSGLAAIQRHRAVYAAVQDMMPREIHALSVSAKSPEEVAATPPPPG
ncbi:MAG: BolA family transcriptional regulator [Pseudomonadota bacterium]|nr:BolA family transcriptional regulator [Pseudomonadota bacterium]